EPYFSLSNRPTRPFCGPPDGGACVRPVPGVVNWAPRVFRKTMNGFCGGRGAVVSAPPPSQLISRRPLVCGPALPLLGSPKAERNASTVDWIESEVGPAA